MNRFIYKALVVLSVFMISSCDLDLLDSPNDVTLESADPNFLLTRIQTDFVSFFWDASGRGGRVTRMFHQASDTYEIAYAAVQQDGLWSNAYANILADINTLKQIASERNFRRHLGIAKTIEAYVWMQLVDNFGNVPFSQAFDSANFNPKQDDGATVYTAALNLLIEARQDFTATETLGTPVDLFFGGNYAKWVKLTNALELRYHLNRRLIDKAGATAGITKLINEANLPGVGDDFVFSYTKNVADPATRHPAYVGQFPNGGGDYQSVFFMWHLTEAKGFDDPRAPYYFYRQVGVNPTNEAEVRCIKEFKPAHYPVDMVWCMPGTRGYWGRDHLDPQGIPPDGPKRTLWGLYPAGATFDNNMPTSMTASNLGNGGAGIQPIMLAAFVDFMLAEAALELGTPGDPKALMLSGITKHINYVRSWSLGTAEAAKVRAYISDDDHAARRTQYLNKVGQDYDDSSNKMRIIAREYWISLFGNGAEAYNLYRRTGQPDNMQPGQIPNFGKFPRSFFYPSNHVERNNQANQKASHDVQVFWDNNPPGFIN
jgi:hypothetical protein